MVEDGGRGFDVCEALGRGQRKGMGLATIQKRAEMLGGELQVESRIGRGTKARMALPMEPE